MSRTTRTLRRGAVAALIGTGLALAVPSLASAHVGVSPDALAPDAATVLTFSFTHGCETSPTTALRITMPEGLASVSPTVDGDWKIAVDRGDDGLVTAVTYTANTPIPSDLRGAVSMQVRPAEDAPESFAFPVEQLCETGVNEWTELAAEGEDPHELDSPAPVVSLQAADADIADAGHSDHAASGGAQASDAGMDTSDASAPVGIALGAGGLVAGLAALIVAILAYRRRTA
ncbi:YcnI family copper-binding membrane protein [Microbacterium sp. NPDC055903]